MAPITSKKNCGKFKTYLLDLLSFPVDLFFEGCHIEVMAKIHMYVSIEKAVRRS